jgi:hypothetical protein
VSSLRYPYVASPARETEIRHNWEKVSAQMSEAEVIDLTGPC